MNRQAKNMLMLLGFYLALGVGLLYPGQAAAHCDTLAGPVVAAAQTAMDSADITPILKWVSAEDEAQIRAAFAQTLAVRKQSPEARELADKYFFETLVRIHRAGEGAPALPLGPRHRRRVPVHPRTQVRQEVSRQHAQTTRPAAQPVGDAQDGGHRPGRRRGRSLRPPLGGRPAAAGEARGRRGDVSAGVRPQRRAKVRPGRWRRA